MSDVVVPIRCDSKTKLYFVRLPAVFYGMVGGNRVNLKTKNRMEAQERLAALATVAQLTNASIGEF